MQFELLSQDQAADRDEEGKDGSEMEFEAKEKKKYF